MSKKYYQNIVTEPLEVISGYMERIPEEVSPDKIITLAKILTTIKNLKGEIDNDLLREILYSVGIEAKEEKRSIHGETRIAYQSSMNILKRIIGRKKVNISSIVYNHMTANDILDYIWLRSKGLLTRSRDRRLLVNKKIYDANIEEQLNREITLNDILKYLKELPSSLWHRIINWRLLYRLRDREVVDLARKYYGYNKRTDQEILSELSRRLKEPGEHSIDMDELVKDTKLFSELVRRNGYLGPLSLPYIKKPLRDEKIINNVARDIQELPLNQRWKLLSGDRISKKLLERIIGKLDLLTLSGLNENRFNGELRSRILLGKALSSYISYYITGNIGYLDYSLYLIDKIDPRQIDPKFKPIYESLSRNDLKLLTYNLATIYPSEIIEFLSYKVWEQYTTTGAFDRRVIEKAIRLGYMMLKYIIKHRGEQLGREENSYRGRINVRKTLFNYTRNNYYIIYRSKRKVRRINTLIDVSGSMTKYSILALISLAKLLSLTKYIVIFSDKASIVRIHKKYSKEPLIKLLEKIYMEGFRGYTNLSLAFKTIYRYVNAGDHIFVITDLKQTVKDIDPVIVINELLSKNVKIHVLVPPKYNTHLAEELEKLGVTIHHIRSLNSSLLKKIISS